MAEQDTKKIALFFLLALLDEKMALEATRSVLKKTRKNSEGYLKIVFQTFLSFRETPNYRLLATGIIQETTEALPNINLSAWRQFLRDAEPRSLFPLIWTQIIKGSEAEVASAMEISKGTLLTRVGQTLEKLGGFVQAESHHD